MIRPFARTLATLFVFSALSVHAADHDGILGKLPQVFGAASSSDGVRLELKAIPEFQQRLFVPVVPEAENTLRIDNASIDAIVETPAGFELERFGGGLRITTRQADAAGYARVQIGARQLMLTLVTLVPYRRVHAGLLDGYRIGEYLNPLRNRATYERPKGFVRLTAANRDLWISDHYRLRDFQCKLDGSSKFLFVRPEALIKLELLQNMLQTRRGVKFDRFAIMSGFRTPFYNRLIGNETSYSRHLYGDAMDIYVDQNHDGAMDDINADGRVNAEDARFLLQFAEAIDRSVDWGWLKGGAGIYHATAAHGPYLHVDARGYVARWGV